MTRLRLELLPYSLRFAAQVTTAHGSVDEAAARPAKSAPGHPDHAARESRPPRAAGATEASRSGIEVRIADAEGRLGRGEAAPLEGFGSETLVACAAALRLVEEAGLDEVIVLSPAAIDAALDALPQLARAPSARCGLELALLDLGAQRANEPLSRWLSSADAAQAPAGASDPRTPRLETRQTLPAVDFVRCSALLADHETSAPGFSTLKLKVGRALLADDVDRVRAVRDAVGPHVALRLDANGAWTAAQAEVALRALLPFSPELCEQPIAPGQPQAWAALRTIGIKLAADESMADPAEAAALISGRLIDAVVLKPQALGGHLRALRLARSAADKNISAIVTTALEGVIGRAGAVQLAAAVDGLALAADGPAAAAEDRSALPQPPLRAGSGIDGRAGVTVAHGLATAALLQTDLAVETMTARAGRIELSPAPGLGLGALECPVSLHARRTPDAVALRFGDESISWRQFDARVRRTVAKLRASGAKAGDRVALLADGSPAAAALLQALARLGAPAVLLNTRLTRAELMPLIATAAPRLLVAEESQREKLPEALALADLAAGDEGAAQTADREGPRPQLQVDAVQTVLFTSGTTGTPRAVLLTVGAHLASARAAERLLELDAASRWLCCLPLFHVGGLSILQRCALVGGCAVLLPRFDADAVARSISEAGITHVSLVATTLLRTLDALGTIAGTAPAGAPGIRLRAVMVGGGPVPGPLLDRARRAGFPVLQTYGLTEAASHVTCERLGEADGLTAGPAVPGAEIRISGDEIEVRGPTLLSNPPGDTFITSRLTADGWLRTGDLGSIDARGRLTVHARRTDLILSGGENVYPAEVEAALVAHPSIAEAAVAARTDQEWGQIVVAVVVRRHDCSQAELDRFLRTRLAAFKLPRAYVWLDEVPKNAAGKVDRAALAKLVQ